MARAKINTRSRPERRDVIDVLENEGCLGVDVSASSSSQESRSVVDLTDETESEEDVERDMLGSSRAKRLRKDTVIDLALSETSELEVADASSKGDTLPAPEPARKAKLTARAVKPLVTKASSRMVQDVNQMNSAIAAATPRQPLDRTIKRSVTQASPVATPPPPISTLPATPAAQKSATLKTPDFELLLPATVHLMDATGSSASEPPLRRPPHLQRYFTDVTPHAASKKFCFRCGCPPHRGQPCRPPPVLSACSFCTGFHPKGGPCPGGVSRDCKYQDPVPAGGQAAVDVPLCNRCGRTDCIKTREGACSYDPGELVHVRCLSCGQLGHLCCAPASTLHCQPACSRCGSDTHVVLQCKTKFKVKTVNAGWRPGLEYRVSKTFVGPSRWAKLLS